MGGGGGVQGAEEKGMKEVVERSAEVLGNLNALAEDVRDLIAGVQEGRGTLGKLLTDEQAYNHLNSILARGDLAVTNVQAGQGRRGRHVTSDEIDRKAEKELDD